MATYTRCLSFPIFLVLFLASLAFYCVIILVIEPWLGLESANGLFHSLLFSLLTLLLLLSYFPSIFKDPGKVPPTYAPNAEEEMGLTEVKRKDGTARYCQKCFVFKPPRAHHCRICKRCVLRMDHHCIWINNCVGNTNYKSFFLFVLYTEAALLHGLALMIMQFFSTWQNGDSEEPMANRTHRLDSLAASLSPSPQAAAILRILCFLYMLPLAVSLLVLLVWHVYLLSKNKTTIEHYEGVRAKWLANKSGERNSYRHPYDLGIVENMHIILGPSFLSWLWPLSTSHIGDGLSFVTTMSPQQRLQRH